MKSLLITIVALAMLMVSATTTQVKNGKAFSQYPWSGKVYNSHEMVIDDVVRTGRGKVLFLFVSVKEGLQFIRSHRRADA